tara:strand:+ start:3520 stop:4161 length:642 start_codon:yes stop_codon:yes gene_type:complete
MTYNPLTYWIERHKEWAGKSDAALRRAGGKTLHNGENDPTNARCAAIANHVIQELRAVNGTSLLDVGCATGRLSACVLKEHPVKRWTGVDLSGVALEAAQKRLRHHAHTIQTFTLNGSIQWPSFEPCDVSLCSDVLYHANTKDSHDFLIANTLERTAKTAMFVTWDTCMSATKGLGAHNSYYPFPAVVAGWELQSFDLPIYKTSVLHILRKTP